MNPRSLQDEKNLPDGLWMQVDNLLVFDQVKRKIWALAYADLRNPHTKVDQAYKNACSRVNQMVSKLSLPLEPKTTKMEWIPPGSRITGERSNLNVQDYKINFTKPQFCPSVNKAKEYIKTGDIFQVVISQQFSTEYTGDPFGLYRSLRQINPSPCMAYFHFDDWQIIGSRREVMVKADSYFCRGKIKSMSMI